MCHEPSISWPHVRTPPILTYANSPFTVSNAADQPTPTSILCQAQQHQGIQALNIPRLVKSSNLTWHCLPIKPMSHKNPCWPCIPTSNADTITPKSTNAYCSSTHQDSFPSPWHRLLTINPTPTPTPSTPRLHLHCISSPDLVPYSSTLYPSPIPFTDSILYESYKYALHVPIFSILDIKVVSVSILSSLSSQLSSRILTNSFPLRQHCRTRLALSSLATTTITSIELSTKTS